jgi:hypothetical protein
MTDSSRPFVVAGALLMVLGRPALNPTLSYASGLSGAK